MCSDDAQTRAKGIFEVSIRRDSGYSLVFGKSLCYIPFVFDVKFARDDSLVINCSFIPHDTDKTTFQA